MNKLLLTGLAISWRVDYDEKGEAKGKHVAIYADAREVAPFGRRLGANMMMSEVMLEQVMYVHELQHLLRMVKCDKKIEL